MEDAARAGFPDAASVHFLCTREAATVVRIGVKEARASLSRLLQRVCAGEEGVLLSRGKEVARLVPAARPGGRLPSLARFRASLRIRGASMSATVLKARKDDRF